MRSADARARVSVLGTGGTIACLGSSPFDLADYGEDSELASVDRLLALTPELAELAELVAVDVCGLGGNAVGPEVWLDLRDTVVRLVDGDASVAGAVITHGTATLEETAYFLHLTLPTAAPIAVVGAQRPPSAVSPDGPMNLAAGIRVAACADAAGIGVTVVMNDQIHCARDVTKSSVRGLDAFQSRTLGPLGLIEADGSVALHRSPGRRHTAASCFSSAEAARRLAELPRIDIAYSYAGSDGAAIRGAIAAGAKGVVVAALAPGLVTPGEALAIDEALDAGLLIVMSTRAGSGSIALRTVDRDRGVVAAGDLTPQKARILAMLALLQTDDREAIRELYATY